MEVKTVNQDYLNLENGKLFYTLAGEGEPILFIHGNFNDHNIWNEQLDCFSPYYQTIGYDLRGYGLSSIPKSPFSNVKDLKQLVDHLSLRNINVIGSSIGAGVAIDFTIIFPHLVKSLVLVAPTISGKPYPISITLQGIKNFLNVKLKGPHKAIEAFIQNSFWNYFFPSSDKKEARSKVLQNVRNTNNFCTFSPKLLITDKPYAIHQLHCVNIPALIIYSDREHVYNQQSAKELNRKLKQSTIFVFEGCGHLPFVEEPQLFNKLVLDFIASCDHDND